MKLFVAGVLALLAATPCTAYFDRFAELDVSKHLLQAAAAHASLPELKVRDRLLKLTPLGSSPQQVLHVITDVLHKPSNGYHKNFYTPRTSAVDPGHPHDEMYVAGCTGIRYAETAHGWFTGTDTDVSWYFDDHDRLISIIVWEHPYGL